MIINASAHQIPLADKSVHAVVTSPPYFAMPPYYGIIRLWQTDLNQMVDSRRASDVDVRPSSKRASTGDRTNRTGTRIGLFVNTSKSSDQRERLRLRLVAQMRIFSSGSGSTKFHEEASIKREQSSIGGLKAKTIRCTADADRCIQDGEVDTRQSAQRFITRKSGQGQHWRYGSATKLHVRSAALQKDRLAYCTFIILFHFACGNFGQKSQI